MPRDFDSDRFLDRSMLKVVTLPQHELFNKIIDNLKSDRSHALSFCSEIWTKLNEILDVTIPKDNKSLRLTNKNSTAFLGAVSQYTSTKDCKSKLRKLFKVHNVASQHYRVSYSIVVSLRDRLMKDAAQPLKQEAKEQARRRSRSYKGSQGGLRKFRYLSGWCVSGDPTTSEEESGHKVLVQ